MKLIGMLDSPYVRRVAISAKCLGIDLEHESVSVFRHFERFQQINPVVKAPTLIDDDVVARIESLVPLAPLHNPAALSGITVARKLLPSVPQVAVLRFLVAMGTGGEWAVAAALVAEVFPRRGRAQASGIFHATSILGGMAALPGTEWTGTPPPPQRQLATVRHVFTHFSLDLAIQPRAEPCGDGWWHPIDRIADAGLPTLYRRAAERALDACGDTRAAA